MSVDTDQLNKIKKEELIRLLTKRRLRGLEIDLEFAAVLDEQHGIRNDQNKRYSVRSLKHVFTRYMSKSAEETRETFSGYQELQKRRLESLLAKVLDEIDPDTFTESDDRYPLTHKDRTAYLKEARNIIAELSKLTGANAPVELLVSGRIESEITLIFEAIKEHLPEDRFNEVATVLKHVMGLSEQRLTTAEQERKQLVNTLEAQVLEHGDI